MPRRGGGERHSPDNRTHPDDPKNVISSEYSIGTNALNSDIFHFVLCWTRGCPKSPISLRSHWGLFPPPWICHVIPRSICCLLNRRLGTGSRAWSEPWEIVQQILQEIMEHWKAQTSASSTTFLFSVKAWGQRAFDAFMEDGKNSGKVGTQS